MNHPVSTLVLIGLQLATALGIVIFWSLWFRVKHDERSWPEGYRRHEQAFVAPDLLLALLLVVSSLLSLGNVAQGSKIALVAAGMMLFLAVLDATYFLQQGMFARERGGVGNALLVGGLLGLSLVMILHYV